MKTRLFTLVILFCCLLSCSSKEETKVLRLAHGLDTNHPVHLAMVDLGKQLKITSKGKLTVKIYPSGQLGAERECLELLQIGSLDITKVSGAVLENFVPEYKVLSVPYLFRDKNHSHTVYDSPVGRQFLEKGEDYRLRGLCFYDAGSRSFYTKNRPIETPDDLKGMKIRVQKSNMAVSMVQQLGGSPTPISWGELYTALQQGVVDGAENNLPSFHTSKHYEVCNYYSFDEHTAVPDVLLVGTETWNRLSENERGWLQQAADASAIYQRELWAEAEAEALKVITEAGVKINYPNKALFAAKTKKFDQLFEPNSEAFQLMQSIKKMQ
ncbi:TRAP transporter substrate-binding protein [Flagellimonas meridianipacifica]|uniref:Tripartite ATP-independent transporter DctP family solute receptor n=1 Tax=Flagellimonas meridianipacifica TaxID=1080225 RepID=A0A2T0MFF0_9FLAO|nr:TRAP transporter substrate-binding protein [Allomuricauda pacifica]PRX56300.1 tripartite ATP-independent transporter DctP family solute receptor [Allomuricauda pacifica]